MITGAPTLQAGYITTVTDMGSVTIGRTIEFFTVSPAVITDAALMGIGYGYSDRVVTPQYQIDYVAIPASDPIPPLEFFEYEPTISWNLPYFELYMFTWESDAGSRLNGVMYLRSATPGCYTCGGVSLDPSNEKWWFKDFTLDAGYGNPIDEAAAVALRDQLYSDAVPEPGTILMMFPVALFIGGTYRKKPDAIRHPNIE
jgi:hypothetical protein